MIKVEYKFNNDSFTYLNVSGHALFADTGKDLICAAVSSIIFGLMNGLDGEKDVIIEEKNNRIVITNNSNSLKANNFIELALIQLKTIEESYHEFIKIERIGI